MEDWSLSNGRPSVRSKLRKKEKKRKERERETDGHVVREILLALQLSTNGTEMDDWCKDDYF